MVLTPSTMLPLGTQAPDFSLPNVDGNTISLGDSTGAKATLVIFMCNHCPYVIHVAPELARLAREYQARGVAVIGINSNDVTTHPADSPEQMVHEVEMREYTFPYLFDETQAVAKAYKAACTPDFFLFDANQKLVYRGQLDDSRPNSGIPLTGKDLRAALDQVLAGQSPHAEQKPSIGCNIKWRADNEPEYFK
ncbi:MAG: thioredoxin family protein [Pirellulales bacterium]